MSFSIASIFVKKKNNKNHFCFHMDNSVYLTLFYRLVSLDIFFKYQMKQLNSETVVV